MKHQSPNPVHPRLRGELFACHKLSFALFGSSPLTRGTLTEFLWPRLSMRFIPAYAGNSEGQSIRAGSETVHPRLRGELLPRTSRTKNAFGSSPLTRGTHAQDLTACFNQRFIPAYAGNSGESKMGWWADSVHPRLRGELTDELYSAVRRTGSSPLTRGTQQETFGARQRPRFIPAYAGNSNSLISFEVNMTVHPRLRGELT